MARPKGFEPLTPRFVVWCSIQLSYGRICHARDGQSAIRNRPGQIRKEKANSETDTQDARPTQRRIAIVPLPQWQGFLPGMAYQALTRSSRQESRSTAWSGIVRWKVAPMVPSTRRISPPCARTSSAAMARPSPVPPGRADPEKAWNRCSRGARRKSRPGIGHLDHDHAALAPAGHADLIPQRIVRRARFQRLHGVTCEIEQHPEHVIVVGVHLEPALDGDDPADIARGIEPECLVNLIHQPLDRNHPAIRRRFLRATIGQCRLAELDRALERAHKLWREALYPRIAHARQLIRDQLRRRQHVAQIMVDLRHRKPERSQSGTLMQHGREIALHRGKFAFGDADLIVAL